MNAHPARKTDAGPGHVSRRLTAVPDLLALHTRLPERYPHLLASVAQGTPRARYDILFAFPGATLALGADAALTRDGRSAGTGDFLYAFEREWRSAAIPAVPGEAAGGEELPFTGGWFVFLGYELAGQIEPTVGGVRSDPAFPLACATRVPAAIVVDHVLGQGWLVCETEQAGELLPQLEADCRVPAAGDGDSEPEVRQETGRPRLHHDHRLLRRCIR